MQIQFKCFQFSTIIGLETVQKVPKIRVLWYPFISIKHYLTRNTYSKFSQGILCIRDTSWILFIYFSAHGKPLKDWNEGNKYEGQAIFTDTTVYNANTFSLQTNLSRIRETYDKFILLE